MQEEHSLSILLSEEFGLIQESLETLHLVNVGISKVPQQLILTKALSRMPGLYEIDLSENNGVKLYAFLSNAQRSCTNLQTIQFTNNKKSC